jgi:glycosyltransferase involved in cell wall biosynthesis
MNVAVDFTAGVRQRAGVGHYTRSLVRALADALAEAGSGSRLTLLWAGPPRIDPPTGWPGTRTRRLPLPERLMTVAWQRLRLPVPADLLAGGADVFYSPDFALPPLARARSVVTVHDLSYLTHPETHFPALRKYLEAAVPRAVARADRVLADSEHTRRDLMTHLGLAAEKIDVVLSAADPIFRRVANPGLAAALRRREIEWPYVISVGTIQPRKNLPVVFDALRQVRHTVRLVHVGRPGWLCEPIFDSLERSGVKDRVVFLQDVDDAELAALYAGAVALVFPSLYEGFGLPCLEAMTCGTPVIASRAGSLAEVIGDAAIAVDPMDATAIAAAIERMIDDAEYRAVLVRRGEAQASRFSWETSGRQLTGILEEVAAL